MISLPYWLDFALRPVPALAWMVIGLGLPWALVLLPRKDWRNRPLIALVMIAVGPLLLTAWMFALGTLGGASESAQLTPANILLGTLPVAIGGAVVAFRKWRSSPPPALTERQRLALDERLLVILIVAACVLRWLAAVWYPFWEYDPIWVYGYEGRLYTLLGYIPQNIGYYPQFLPLQYAYAQIMTGGINDHAARAAFPLYHWGSILAAYALGRLNVSRRVGVYMAALWAMYPHVAQWSTVGDLEIPLTFAATGVAAFFLAAWQRHDYWRRYAIISGLFLGLALWTKPTGGALILGIVLLAVWEIFRTRFDWRKWWPRFQVAAWCGIASIPIGALWYIRNVLLSHRAIDFPHPFWLTQAMRSGVEFGWPVLAAALLCAWLLWGKGLRVRPALHRLLIGWGFLAAALLPSILSPHRMGLIEWALLLVGAGILLAELWPLYAFHATALAKRETQVVGWALLLAFPYFVVWFISYSYHYRLSFAIVPLMMLPVAILIARWIPPQRPLDSRPKLTPRIGLPLILLCIPAVIAPLYHYEGGWDYLWSNEYPNDWRRLDSTNYALSQTVQRIALDVEERGLERPVIFAPGLQRLPFFFPLADVRIRDTPTDLDQLRGVDYYVFTQEARWLYEENNQPEVNPVTGSMYRPEILSYFGGTADASFFSRLYRVRDIDARYVLPENLTPPPEPATWPFATLAGTQLVRGTELGGRRTPRLTISFLASGPAPLEYTLYIHLLAPDGTLITTWDSLPAVGPYGWYSTRFWVKDEVVSHLTELRLPEGVSLQPGVEYRIRIGWYDVFDDNRRVMADLNDGTQSDGVFLPYIFTAAP